MKKISLVVFVILVTALFFAGCIAPPTDINDNGGNGDDIDVPQIIGYSVLPAEEEPSGPAYDELPDIASQVTQVLEQDRPSMPDSYYSEIGDTWTGPSGTIYVYVPTSLTGEQTQYLDLINVECTGEWVPVGGR